LLAGIWEQVLGVERVGVGDNFFQIGGDSILSIQVSSRLRVHGKHCHVKDIFTYKTIEKLSSYLDSHHSGDIVKTEQGVLTGGFDLLPIQRWFASRVDGGDIGRASHWNQSFLIRVPPLELDRLGWAVEQLVWHHDVLRIRYDRSGSWQQFYQSSLDLPPVLKADIRQYSDPGLQQLLTDWQSGFDLDKGPLFQVGYLSGYPDGSSRVFMALHHMIVDAVSWRILSQDLQTLYEGGSLPLKGSSYRQWVETVSSYPSLHVAEGTYWGRELSVVSPYQGVPGQQQTFRTLELDVSLTGMLLHSAPGAYHTEINDLLLTALAYALSDLNGSGDQLITLEGHGREGIDDSIDHSQTVGWFTSMFPVRLSLGSTVGESIRSVKEGLRRIPNKGVGFGAYAVSGDFAYGYSDLAPVSFNYLGQFGREGHQDTWSIVLEGSGANSQPGVDHLLININGMITDGVLRFNIGTRLGSSVSDGLCQGLEKHLRAVVADCVRKLGEEGAGYTGSDFPEVVVSQGLLDRLSLQAHGWDNELGHIYPATSLQQGFIYHALSQSDDDAYRVQQLYDYDQGLDVQNYVRAWELCIAQYPILRTAFNWDEDLIQVVYQRGRLDYRVHDVSGILSSEERDAAIASIQATDREERFDLSKPTLLRLHIIKRSDSGYTVLKTDHHSISDGWSTPILLGSLHRYYNELCSGNEPPVQEDTSYLRAQEYISSRKEELSVYWQDLLSGLSGNDLSSMLSEPVDLSGYRHVEQSRSRTEQIVGSTYRSMKELSHREGITMSVLVQFLWHKLVQVYSGSGHSIVGTTVSGRDLPVAGINESVGLYINTLPLVVDWDNDRTVVSQLHHIQSRLTDVNTHSYAELAKLHKSGDRLFQSLLVFENYPLPKGGDGSFSAISIRDVIEKLDYPLSLVAFEHHQGLVLKLQYDGACISDSKAQEHLGRLVLLLDQVLASPHGLHRDLSLLSAAEYDQVVYGWNQTDRLYPSERSLHSLFEQQVLSNPDAVAVVYEGVSLTYAELNRRSNQLARHLRAEHVRLYGAFAWTEA
jgi:non-ribosomal peptide synthase protein (TIGR01720 family)